MGLTDRARSGTICHRVQVWQKYLSWFQNIKGNSGLEILDYLAHLRPVNVSGCVPCYTGEDGEKGRQPSGGVHHREQGRVVEVADTGAGHVGKSGRHQQGTSVHCGMIAALEVMVYTPDVILRFGVLVQFRLVKVYAVWRNDDAERTSLGCNEVTDAYLCGKF